MDSIGHRGRMRDTCVVLYAMLLKRREISLTEIEKELGLSNDTARRWVDSFGLIMPIRLERGMVVVGDASEPLHAK